MADAYNWAKMCSKKDGFLDNQSMTDEALNKLRNLYKSIWTATLGTEEGFDSFFQECSTPKMIDGKPQILVDGKPVNGATFQKKLESEFARLNGGKELNSGDFASRVGSFKSGDRKIDNAMSMIATQYSRTEYINADTHMAAGFLMGEGYHLQQGCGQGKSSAVATSTFMVRGGAGAADKQMFVTSSTPELAAQSFGDIAGYFDDLGIGQQSKNGEFQQGVSERLFLMTEKGPKVAVRLPNGKMLTKNDKNGTNNKGFDDTQCCETEDMRFVIESGKARLARRQKVEGESRLQWEPNTVTFSGLSAEQQKQALQSIYGDKENIIFADNAQVVQDNMRGAIPSGVERHAIMDEGDYVKNDQFHYLQQVGKEYEDQGRRTDCRKDARAVIKELKLGENESLYEHNLQTQFTQFTDVGVNKVREVWARLNPDKPLTNEMMNFIEEALVVETVFVKGTDYVVEGDKIISQAKASGTAIELPQGISQALAVKENSIAEKDVIEIPPEKKVFNIQTITGAYDKIFGEDGQTRASGTHEAGTMESAVVVANLKVAGSRNEAAIAAAETDEKKIDAIFQNTRYRTVMKDQKNVDEAIMAETEAVLQSGRPVLIGCVTSQDVEVMKDQIRGKESDKEQESSAFEIIDGRRVITYTAETSKRYDADLQAIKDGKVTADVIKQKYGITGDLPGSFDKYVKQQGGKKNTIVLGTSIIGRGANIGIEDEPPEKMSEEDKKKYVTMNDRGGLHVITRGLHPSSVRQMVQFINRSMRGKQKGSSHEFFSVEEIQNARPQIDASIKDLEAQIDVLVNNQGEFGDKERKELGRLQDLHAEFDRALQVIDSSQLGTTFSGGSKGVVELLDSNNQNTIQVDNDGRPVQPTDKANEGEVMYRCFYAVADERNKYLSVKAHTVEELVTETLDTLLVSAAKLDCADIAKRKDIARDMIPEFMGRALQIQYKANGHTAEEITQQCSDEISLLGDIYIAKMTEAAASEQYEAGKPFAFDEQACVDSLTQNGKRKNAANRIFVLSDEESKEMRETNKSQADRATELVDIQATVSSLSKDELKAAYAELQGLENTGKIQVSKDQLFSTIARSGITLSQVKEAVAKVQERMRGSQENAQDVQHDAQAIENEQGE